MELLYAVKPKTIECRSCIRKLIGTNQRVKGSGRREGRKKGGREGEWKHNSHLRGAGTIAPAGSGTANALAIAIGPAV